MKKVSVKTLFLIGIITIGLISLGIGSTYAMFTSNISIDNPITINTTLTCEEEVIDTIDISIEANDFRVIVININNITSSNLNYSSFYISDNSDIEVGVTRSFSDGNTPTGSIGSNSIKKVYIQVKNNSNTKVNITIGVLSNSGNIIKSDNMILINDNNIDTVKPTVSISKNTSSSRSVTYTFNFSKKVIGFTSSDISVSEGTKSTFTKISDSKYTLVVNHSSDGNKTITVNDNVCTDISGNGNISKSLSHTIYTVKPSVTISANTSSSRTVTYTFTFSTDVTGFTSSDISVSEGTKGTFTKVSNSKYTLVVTHSSDGVKTIAVSAGVCTDSAGNGNTSKSYSHTVSTGTPLATYITNLYNNATKTTATNNSITYNLASSVNLMNDRLGGTTTSLDGGNIRYYGADPNNYIYFNCSDYSNQSSSTCEIWRIIGVFDGKVKLIRNESIGDLTWDNKVVDENCSGVNNWSTARLMQLLNPNYSGTGGSYYWNSGSGTCFSGLQSGTKACDFTSVGIKNVTTRNLISQVTYNLGGSGDADIYVNEMYGKERGTTVISGRPTTWTGKIALMYPSDYGYATDLSKCKNKSGSDLPLKLYSHTNCYNNNWMVSDNNDWTLTPIVGDYGYCYLSNSVFFIQKNTSGAGGWVGVGNYGSHQGLGVRPVLFLNSSQIMQSTGNGTISNPFRIVP